MRFEWDAKKASANAAKHAVTFEEAASSFADELGIAGYDEAHSGKVELRWFWFGRSDKGRILTVRYTHRGQVIRIIGAGAWRDGKELYEQIN